MNFNKRVEEEAEKYEECDHKGVDAAYCGCLLKDQSSFRDGAEYAGRLIVEMLREMPVVMGGKTMTPKYAADFIEFRIKGDE
jgi:hypothetical protein